MARDQDLPAVIAAAVVVEGVLHVICGNGAHHAWDAKGGGWLECEPVPESFVGRTHKKERERQEERAEYDREQQEIEVERARQRNKPISEVMLDLITQSGKKGKTLRGLLMAYRKLWWVGFSSEQSEAALAPVVQGLIRQGVVHSVTIEGMTRFFVAAKERRAPAIDCTSNRV